MNTKQHLLSFDVEKAERQCNDWRHSVPERNAININDLPIELVRYIMGFFNQYELSKLIAHVCRMWRDIAYDPLRWQSLELPVKMLTCSYSYSILLLLSRAPQLRSLTISSRRDAIVPSFDVTNFLLFCSTNCPELNEIRLQFVPCVNCEVINCLSPECFPRLESVSVEGCAKINSTCIRLLCDLSCLTEVNLSHCNDLQNSDIDTLSVSLTRLEKLHIDGLNRITDEAIVNLVDLRGPQLRRLNLDGEGLTDVSFAHIGNCCLMEDLRVSFAIQLTDNSLTSIQRLKQLQVLRLRKGAKFTSNGLCSLFCDSSMSRLHHVDLSECTQANDEVLLALCRCCRRNLRYLGLNWCWEISEVGLSYVVEYCSKLQRLHLCGVNLITGLCLENVPRQLPHLIHLDLQQCPKVADRVIREVLRSKPGLDAVDYYGGNSFGEND